MKSTILVALLAITIRRDANTITPTTVPAHELPILRNMFGKENVTQADQPVGTVEVDPAGEYERLGAKYGHGKVAKVYGDDDGVRLAEMVEKGEVKAPKAEKTPAPDKAPAAAKLTKAEEKAAAAALAAETAAAAAGQ